MGTGNGTDGAGRQHAQEQDTTATLLRLINGYQLSQALYVAAALGLADHLADGPRTCDDLAVASGAHPGALYRLLRALAAAGIFSEQPAHRFALAPLGQSLRSDAAHPLGAWAVQIGQPYFWQTWGHLLHSVRTGENAFRDLHGIDVWEYRRQHPESGAVFDAAMTALSGRVSEGVARAYDFGARRCVVDVGGGQGALLTAILIRHPRLRGVLFDRPAVVAAAPALLDAAGVAPRCDVVGGDFFAAVPDGADAYVLKSVIHDWEDEPATAILRTCRRAIAPDGRLLLVERVIAPPNEGAPAKLSDLNMLVAPGGRERTREEYGALLAAAGFRLAETIPAGGDTQIVEGIPT
jgi:hypothetical protein